MTCGNNVITAQVLFFITAGSYYIGDCLVALTTKSNQIFLDIFFAKSFVRSVMHFELIYRPVVRTRLAFVIVEH